MRRIGIIVEPEFLERHRGVRVYVYSLARVLAQHDWQVEYLVPWLSSGGEWRWRKLHLVETQLFPGAAPSSSGAPLDVWRTLRDHAFARRDRDAEPERVPTGLQRPEVMPIGRSLSLEHYDALIVSNPWMVRWAERLPAVHVFGLVLDVIPNLFGVILADHKPFTFAHQHAAGFRYYEQHCDTVLAISADTRDRYIDLIRPRGATTGPPVVALPPMPPYYAVEPEAGQGHRQPARAGDNVLAGCFDPRKGLRELPALLNGVADLVDRVVIYGGPRCREHEADAFFTALEVPRVTWHLGPGVAHVRDIYRTSRLLLFPSRFEGLGLPLIEAQLEGTRVATYAVSPMQELGLPGAVTLSDDLGESIAALRAALSEPFDHEALRTQARAHFVDPVRRRDPLTF
jgi:glycosyltransferase involved in cell wall biosynthesis